MVLCSVIVEHKQDGVRLQKGAALLCTWQRWDCGWHSGQGFPYARFRGALIRAIPSSTMRTG
jgi:hypothetical protein